MLIPYSEAYGEGFEDMPRRVPDLSKVRDAVGWKPTADLDKILADVIRHQKAGGSGAEWVREPTPVGPPSNGR
jgi:hypothetical protein